MIDCLAVLAAMAERLFNIHGKTTRDQENFI
jgi:hypothetical protein